MVLFFQNLMKHMWSLSQKLKIPEDHPIQTHYSLSNVICSIASEVLANRLKRLFPHIIIKNQSAFMSKCLITDNVQVAFKTMHHIN